MRRSAELNGSRVVVECAPLREGCRWAIETSQFWAPPRKCPGFRWRDYEEELAAISPAIHKAVGDALPKAERPELDGAGSGGAGTARCDPRRW